MTNLAPRRSTIQRGLVWTTLLAVLIVCLPPLMAQTDSGTKVRTARTTPAQTAATDSPPGQTAGIPTTIFGMVKALNYWVIPFALCTLIAVWFTVERLVVVRRGRVIPKAFVQRFLKLLEDGELAGDEAMQICEENGSPVALVFAHGVRKWGKPSVEVEQAIIDGGERVLNSLRAHLRVLNTVVQVGPLLGLLGTVWGMLQSFNTVAQMGSMGRSDQLAGGIALALVTTAAGLAVAIPSLVSYSALTGMVDSRVSEIDELSQRVVINISAEALAERASRPRRVAKTEAEPAAKKRAV